MPDTPDLVKLLQSTAFQAGRVRRTPDPDGIHDLRVSIRRFGQALAVFKSCFPPKILKKARRTLKDTLELAGEVRNCDVATEYLAKIETENAKHLAEAIQLRRSEKQAALVEELNRWARRKLSAKWRQALAPVELRPDFGHLTDCAGKFLRAGEKAAGGKSSAKQLHALRLSAKKFRYTLELFAPSFEPAASEWLERIARVQTRLGRINDCRTIRSLIADLGGDADIEAGLKRRQRRRVRDFRKLWRDEFESNPPCFPERKPAGRSTGGAALAQQA